METELERRIVHFVARALSCAPELVRACVFHKEVLVQIDQRALVREGHTRDAQRKLLQTVRSALTREFRNVFRVVVSQIDQTVAHEDALRAIVNERFPALCKKVVLSSIGSHGVDVWLVPSEEIDGISSEIRQALGEMCRNYAALASFRVRRLEFVGHERHSPTGPAILRAIKVLQPVSVQQLRSKFFSSGYHVPSGRWLENELDRLRRLDHVTLSGRPADGSEVRYCLTSFGLRALPRQLGRNSADVERALELSRRKW